MDLASVLVAVRRQRPPLLFMTVRPASPVPNTTELGGAGRRSPLSPSTARAPAQFLEVPQCLEHAPFKFADHSWICARQLLDRRGDRPPRQGVSTSLDDIGKIDEQRAVRVTGTRRMRRTP